MKLFLSVHIEPLSCFLYLGALIFYSWKIESKYQYKVLCAYYLVATALLARVAIGFETDNSNTHIYNFLYLITSLSLAYYFYLIFDTQIKRWIAITAGLVTLINYVGNTEVFRNEIYFDSIGHVITSTGIVVLIFLYLHQLLTNITDEPLSHNFNFWFVCAQLFYHLGSFAIFLSYNFFTKKVMSTEFYTSSNKAILTYLWVVHNVLLFLGAFITCYGTLWIYRKRLRSS